MNKKQWPLNLALLLLPLIITPVHASLEGELESVNCDVIKGWAWDSAQPTTRVKLDIYDVTTTKTTRLTTVIAQTLRNDLLAAGKGDGKYGFVFNLPVSIRTATTHKFSVRFQGTIVDLTHSPKSTATVCYGKLNDTGIKLCGNGLKNGLVCPVPNYTGQDGDYGRDAKARVGKLVKIGAGDAGFDFTKIANDGSVLPSSAKLGAGAKEWACTLDNVTGMLWEVKTADGGLRDQYNTYSWFNPNSNINGGEAGHQNLGICTGNISCDTQGYTNAINALKLCNKSDWRVPSIVELYTIINSAHYAPAIDSKYFPNTVSSWFWSSTPEVIGSYAAWYMNFGYGGDGNGDSNSKRHTYAVRLVRGG